MFVADAAEKYHHLNTELHISTWVRDASADEMSRLKEVGQRISDIGPTKFETWMGTYSGTPEGNALHWLYVLLDHAAALPEG